MSRQDKMIDECIVAALAGRKVIIVSPTEVQASQLFRKICRRLCHANNTLRLGQGEVRCVGAQRRLEGLTSQIIWDDPDQPGESQCSSNSP